MADRHAKRASSRSASETRRGGSRPAWDSRGVDGQPGGLTLSEGERRVLISWATACAEQALPLFENEAPDDPRPRYAITGARAFARGDLRIGVARALSAQAQAHAAARQVAAPTAAAAARAAGHAGAVAHMASHALEAASYAARAASLAEPEGAEAAVARSLDRAERHASKEVRELLGRLSPRGGAAGTSLAGLAVQLDQRLADR